MEEKRSIRPGSAIPMEFMSDPEVCDGCGACVTSCQLELGIPEGSPAGIQIVTIGEKHIPVMCHNCEDAPCVTACMPGCRYKDEVTGRIITEYDRCVGCWMCVMLCPFGAIQRIPTREDEHHGMALKCDSCLDKVKVPCIEACVPKGLKEVDPLKLAEQKRLNAAKQFLLIGDE